MCYTGLVHDRRLNGETLVLGNRGQLFLLNMTLYDHGTDSVWLQVTGEALAGPLKGSRLDALPGYTGPWEGWLRANPETKVLTTGRRRFSSGEEPRDDFLIGVSVDGSASAFPYPSAARVRVQNAWVGATPLLVYVDPDTRVIRTFVRRAGERELHLVWADGTLRDIETMSEWDPFRGTAESGQLVGERLELVSHTLSFEWAWDIHFPDSVYYPQRTDD